jgi:hypothetical protein
MLVERTKSSSGTQPDASHYHVVEQKYTSLPVDYFDFSSYPSPNQKDSGELK